MQKQSDGILGTTQTKRSANTSCSFPFRLTGRMGKDGATMALFPFSIVTHLLAKGICRMYTYDVEVRATVLVLCSIASVLVRTKYISMNEV
jgi:hypothetical protein